MKKNNKVAFLIFKRIFDILFSLFMIIFCFSFLWWWIFLINLFVTKGHPFFNPERIGKNKKVFRMLKFRSMKMEANPNLAPSDMNKETQDSMDTKFGKFLRKTSLDETLQFLNIFIGQMSVVGPRPGAKEHEDMLIKARESYTPSAFDVRPGLTGYSQVYMKRQHDVMSKAWFDSEYVKIMSPKVDIKIIVHTFLFIFKGK